MSRERPNWPLRCGVALLGFAGVLAIAPDVVRPLFDPATLDDQLSGGPQARLVGSTLLLAAVVAGWHVRRRHSDASAGGSADVASPTDTASPTSTRGGDARDSKLSEAAAFGPASAGVADAATGIRAGWAHGRAAVTEADRLESRLQTVAAEAIATYGDCEPAAARRQVADGDWTDDRIAASYLGETSAPDAPLGWRLRRWFFPDRTTERAIERTIGEIEGLQGGEHP